MERTAHPRHPGLIGSSPVAPEPLAAGVKTEEKLREPGFSPGWLVAPGTLWLLLFLVVPLLSIVMFSFWDLSKDNVMVPTLTLGNYQEFFTGFSNLKTLWTTFRLSIEVMAISLILGYPIAYFLAMQVKSFKWQLALFLMCMVPFWTSYLIRAIAWIPMLGRRGVLNTFLIWLGIVDKPLSFLLFSEFGLTMALVQLYVVLCIGPIFFSLAKIETEILEAARDMGASGYQIFREIILPLSMPGVAIGMIFIWVLIMGEFATSVVVGGGKTSQLGNIILIWMGTGQYPRASATALVLMAAMMIGVIIIFKLVNIRKQL